MDTNVKEHSLLLNESPFLKNNQNAMLPNKDNSWLKWVFLILALLFFLLALIIFFWANQDIK